MQLNDDYPCTLSDKRLLEMTQSSLCEHIQILKEKQERIEALELAIREHQEASEDSEMISLTTYMKRVNNANLRLWSILEDSEGDKI